MWAFGKLFFVHSAATKYGDLGIFIILLDTKGNSDLIFGVVGDAAVYPTENSDISLHQDPSF